MGEFYAGLVTGVLIREAGGELITTLSEMKKYRQLTGVPYVSKKKSTFLHLGSLKLRCSRNAINTDGLGSLVIFHSTNPFSQDTKSIVRYGIVGVRIKSTIQHEWGVYVPDEWIAERREDCRKLLFKIGIDREPELFVIAQITGGKRGN